MSHLAPNSLRARRPDSPHRRRPDSPHRRRPDSSRARAPDSPRPRTPDSSLARTPDSALSRTPNSPYARTPATSETNSDIEETSNEASSTRSSSDPVCPPGLEALLSMDQVMITQQVSLLEAMTIWESSNEYRIFNGDGQECYTANEDSNCCCRQCCGNSRPFWVRVKDNTGKVCNARTEANRDTSLKAGSLKRPGKPYISLYFKSIHEAITVKRPFKCCYRGISWLACCRLCQDEITVTLGDGQVIGFVREACSLCIPHYKIHDEHGEAKYEVWGQCCNCTCCCCKREIIFTVKSLETGEEIGQIKKIWSGIMKEMFTDADNFGVTFPVDLDVKIKAVLVGCVFLIDFMHFETDEKEKGAAMADAIS